MEEKKIRQGDKLTPALLDLMPGDVLRVPYKLYSLSSIKSTATNVKASRGMAFSVSDRQNFALVTRIASPAQ